MMSDDPWKEKIDEIHQRRKLAKQMGGADAIEKQHQKNRLTIRERIHQLLDADSFDEMGEGAGTATINEEGRLTDFQPANFVLGFGKIDGRTIVVGGEDFTLKGGSPNLGGLRKSVYTENLARHYQCPLVRLHEGGGGSVAGAGGKRGTAPSYGDPVFSRPRFESVAATLGEVPVASAALGPVAGLPAARLVSSHFTVMSRAAQILIAGPQIVKRALNIDMTKEALGGAAVHLKSGVIDNLAENEKDACLQIRKFLSYLPDNVFAYPPKQTTNDDPARAEQTLDQIIPANRRRIYDMREIINAITDKDSVFEMTRDYGRAIITTLARLNGETVGILANNCAHYAGAMDATAARKTRRFVDLCATFHLPIISLVDEPGFMIGPKAEESGAIREGMAAMAAVMQCGVPWASVLIRKTFGVAGAVHFAPNAYVLAWPSAESGAVPVEGGVAIAFGRQIAAAENPEEARTQLEEKLAAAQSPFPRAEGFSVHELIAPSETRYKLCRWLELALKAFHTKPPQKYQHTIRP